MEDGKTLNVTYWADTTASVSAKRIHLGANMVHLDLPDQMCPGPPSCLLYRHLIFVQNFLVGWGMEEGCSFLINH